MTSDRQALVAIASQIADAENRVAQLRWRVERLQREGSDASQAIETLQVVSRDLANFYAQQSVMRRNVWAQKCHDKIAPQSGNLASASAHR
jgi:hypothetical protein